MHIIGYIIVFLATGYSAISIFGLGWSTEPASFMKELLRVGVITSIAGLIASIPKKPELMMIIISAAPVPAMIFILMTQGIIQSRAFHQIHWVAIPVAGAALAVISFTFSRRARRR